jgi:hypothetical protein
LAGTGIPEYSGDSGVIRDSKVQPKGGSCKKIPPEKKRILRNPGRNKKQGPRNDIPETGKCNLAPSGLGLDLLSKLGSYHAGRYPCF